MPNQTAQRDTWIDWLPSDTPEPDELFTREEIAASQVFLAVGIIAVFMLVHFALTFALALTEAAGAQDLLFVTMMFETMSAAATVGLSTGITPSLSDPGKLILCLTMFFGRLGPLTLAYALTRHQNPASCRKPKRKPDHFVQLQACNIWGIPVGRWLGWPMCDGATA